MLYHSATCAEKMEPEQNESKLHKLADEDGSKSLSQMEFSQAIKKYKLDLTDAEMVELFNTFDEDRGGYIEYEEFARQIMRVIV